MPIKSKHAKPRRHSKLYLHEWLKKRNLTAEGLAEQLDTSKSVVSKLANGRQQYTQEWLERIAFALNCDPIALLRDPSHESADDFLAGLTPDERERALKVLKALT